MSALQYDGPTAAVRELLSTSRRGMTAAELRQALPELTADRMRTILYALTRSDQALSLTDPHLPKRTPRYRLTPKGRANLDHQRRSATLAAAAAAVVQTEDRGPGPGAHQRPRPHAFDAGTSTATAMHAKQRESAEIRRLTDEFIARGGRIERLGTTFHVHDPRFNRGHLERT